ncbi:MAG: DUF3810 domain-containing protein [Bacteroidetes bacterium]|nr:DUF3810 domain-containing protein [Bacteroidota bacterium]
MNYRQLFFNQKAVWIWLGVLTIVVGNLAPAEVVERSYSRGIFVVVRWFFTGLNSWWPFASAYVLFFLLAGWAAWRLRSFFKSDLTWRKRLGRAALSLLAFAGGVVFFFQLLWGFNYGRVLLEEKLGISPRPLTVSELRDELLAVTTEVLQHRAGLPEAPDSTVAMQHISPNPEARMRAALGKVLRAHGYAMPGKVRARTLRPKGVLLHISTAGVYIPFVGEGNVDAGLHHLQLPFVLAHELSHACGFGDEGTCNFLAYLACTESDEPYLQYIGHLYYWRYVASEYRSFDPEGYEKFKEVLPYGIRADVRAINREMDKYPDILPELRDAAYNTYLHSQGIEEGMKNYDRVVMLVHAWRRR